MATLEDHLRRVTRNFTAPMPDADLIALGSGIARELARAHAETPLRHPDVEAKKVAWDGTVARLDGGATSGSVAEDLFQLGCLLHSLATATPPEIAWRLDGLPLEAGPVLRRSLLDGLASPRSERRFASAEAAAAAFDRALAATSGEPHPWPLFRGDSARRGAAAGADRTRLELAWSVACGPVVASPVLTASLVLAATADGRLIFIERASGRLVHELRLGSAVESSPALEAGELHVGTDDGDYVAVDLARGEVVRRARLGQVVRSSPLLAEERVIVGAVEPKGLGGLVALDRASGKLAWRLKLKAVFSSPALSGSLALVGSDDGSLHAVDLAKGTLAWSHALGAKVRATPAVAGALAVVGDFTGALAGVHIETGTRAWTAELGAPLYSSACVSSGLAVVGANDGRVHGVDLADGKVRFSFETRGPVVGSPVAIGERLLVPSTDGDLYLVDPKGSVVARLTLSPAGIASSPAVDDAFAVVGSGAGVHGVSLA